MCLLTVRGRNRRRYLAAPYRSVSWAQSAGSGRGSLTHGCRTEGGVVRALSQNEAALVLHDDISEDNPIARYLGVTADSLPDVFECTMASHPLFVLERK